MLVAPYETYEVHDCSTLLNKSLIYSTFSNRSLKVYGELEVGDEFSAYFLYDGERLFPAYRYHGIFVCDEKNADGQADRIRATLKDFTLIGSQYEAIDTFLTFLKLDSLPATNTEITIPYSAIVGIRPHWMNTAHRGFMTVGDKLYLIDYRLNWTDHENQTFTITINTITPISNTGGTAEDAFVIVKEKELKTLADFTNAIGYQSYTGCVHAIASIIGEFAFENDLVWISYAKFTSGECYLTVITADGHIHDYEAANASASFSAIRKTEFVMEYQLDLAEGTYFVAHESDVPTVGSTVSAQSNWFIGKKPTINQDYKGKWYATSTNKWYSVAFTVKSLEEQADGYQYNILFLTVSEEKTLPTGGTAGQILAKKTDADYDTHWIDAPEGGGGSATDSVTMDQVNAAIDTKLDAYTPEEVYSTEEIRIGTWIDGKSLYRKVVHVQTGPADNQVTSIPHGIDSLETVAILNAMLIDAYGNSIAVPYYQDYNNTHQSLTIYADRNKSTLSLSVYNSYQGSFANRPWTIILEYTKTTDQPLNWWSPHMTSNNTPSPYVVSATENDTSAAINGAPYCLFDGYLSTAWYNRKQNPSITFDFGTKTLVSGISLTMHSNYLNFIPTSFDVEGSDDLNTWTTILENISAEKNSNEQSFLFPKPKSFRYFRLTNFVSSYLSSSECVIIISEMKFLTARIAT